MQEKQRQKVPYIFLKSSIQIFFKNIKNEMQYHPYKLKSIIDPPKFMVIKIHSGHKTSFKLPKYKASTKLSTAIWKLKDSSPPIPFQLKFSILKLARAYTRESKRCALCNLEKTMIAFSDPATTLNGRSELMSKCWHRRKHLLFNWKWGFNQKVFFKKNIWQKN